MKIKIFAAAIVSAIMALALTSCGEAKFKVNGEIYDAEGKSVVLEKPDFLGQWQAVDSARIAADGTFSISSPAPASPEIYRLALDGRYIYLPIDSVEQLTVTSSGPKFGTDFNLTGSPQAEHLAAFEKELLALNATDSVSLAKFKRNVYTKYIKDAQGSILGYYLLTKTLGNRPLYDAADREDAKYFAAVATQFEMFRPNDPHAEMLRKVSLDALRRRNTALNGRRAVMANEDIKVLDIQLPDPNSNTAKLSDLVGKGTPVIVVFGMMNEKDSPAFNRQLADIYNKRAASLKIYQVSLDADHYAWRDAARNLPWTNVIDAGGTSDAITKYNVQQLPAFFIFDARGDLRERAEDFATLEKLLSKY